MKQHSGFAPPVVSQYAAAQAISCYFFALAASSRSISA
jgi:hypothetical protein